MQHFVWKPTGLANSYGRTPDPNNHTHWHGMSVGLTHQGWRSDLNKASAKPPAGTKLVFTVTPLSRSIDGRELQPRVIARVETGRDHAERRLHDLPPANYEISGVAKLPPWEHATDRAPGSGQLSEVRREGVGAARAGQDHGRLLEAARGPGGGLSATPRGRRGAEELRLPRGGTAA